jgi:hypothetical protein
MSLSSLKIMKKSPITEYSDMTSDKQFEMLSLLDCFRLLNRGWHVLIS